MGGSYPDVPGRRMAWDADGTVFAVQQTQSGQVTEPSSAVRAEVNDEDNTDSVAPGSGGGVQGGWLIHIFPELREFDGYFARAALSGRLTSLQSSANTTNGIDGGWTTQASDYSDPNNVVAPDEYRTAITSFAASNVRGVRLRITDAQAIRAIHIYGEISPGETPDRLLHIDEATGLEFTASRDYGDVPRGGSEDVTWRIKNNSAGLTAETIQYTTEDLFRGSGNWYTHTLPGGATFQGTRQVASLAPAATSGIITTRRITPGGTLLGLHAGRTYLNVGAWT